MGRATCRLLAVACFYGGSPFIPSGNFSPPTSLALKPAGRVPWPRRISKVIFVPELVILLRDDQCPIGGGKDHLDRRMIVRAEVLGLFLHERNPFPSNGDSK